jgi:hypothetical protein
MSEAEIPVPFDPERAARRQRSLDGGWYVEPDPKNVGRTEGWGETLRSRGRPVEVPACWNEVLPGYEGVAWYFKSVEEPAAAHGEQILLRFDGVDYAAEVWVDGDFAGSHEGGHTPFVLDVTDAWKSAPRHFIAVRVVDPPHDRAEGVDGVVFAEIPSGCQAWFVNYGGIWQGVELIRTGGIYISNVRIEHVPGDAQLRVAVELRSSTTMRVRCRLDILDADRHGLGSAATILDAAPGVRRETIRIRSVHLTRWSPMETRLYTLRTIISVGNVVSDACETRFGVREWAPSGRGFRLGEEEMVVRAISDWQLYPGGLARPGDRFELLRRLKMMRFLGFNAVHCRWRPPVPALLDLCDDVGMLAIVEPTAGPVRVGPQCRPRCSGEVLETLSRDWNHPSVVFWRIGGGVPWPEGLGGPAPAAEQRARYGELGAELRLLAGEVDGTRPILGEAGASGGAAGASGAGGSAGCVEVPARVEGAVDDAAVDRLRSAAGDGSPFMLTEIAVTNLPDFDRTVKGFGKQGQGREDAKAARAMRDWVAAAFDALELAADFGTPAGLAARVQKVRGRALSRLVVGARANPAAAGFFVDQLCDILPDGLQGVRDAFMGQRRGQRYLWRALGPVALGVFVRPSQAVAGEPVRLEVVGFNDTGRPRRERLKIQVKSAAGDLLEREMDVRLTAGRVQGLFEEDVALPETAAGRHNIRVKFGEDCAASESFWVYSRPEPVVGVCVVDPDGVLPPAWVEARGEEVGGAGFIVAPVSDVGRFEQSARLVLEEVRAGARAVFLGLPLEEAGGAAGVCWCAERLWPSEVFERPVHYAASGPGAGTSFHLILKHRLFQGMRTRCIADAEYAGIWPRWSLRVEGADVRAPVLRPPLRSHVRLSGCGGAAGGWWGGDLLTLPFGKGRVVLSTFRLVEGAQSPAARALFANMAAYVGGGPSG